MRHFTILILIILLIGSCKKDNSTQTISTNASDSYTRWALRIRDQFGNSINNKRKLDILVYTSKDSLLGKYQTSSYSFKIKNLKTGTYKMRVVDSSNFYAPVYGLFDYQSKRDSLLDNSFTWLLLPRPSFEITSMTMTDTVIDNYPFFIIRASFINSNPDEMFSSMAIFYSNNNKVSNEYSKFIIFDRVFANYRQNSFAYKIPKDNLTYSGFSKFDSVYVMCTSACADVLEGSYNDYNTDYYNSDWHKRTYNAIGKNKFYASGKIK